MIKAPFNFVPLSDKVFFPDWADKVSHDIPFSDGESGVIDIKITAKSPIFIRDGENEEEFCNYNGQYYIPGSSFKGMIRNVLEIMSFSKMSFVENQKYFVRDMTPDKYGPRGDKKKLFNKPLVGKATHCGFLIKNGDKYQIEECEAIRVIEHNEIKNNTSINLKQYSTLKEKYKVFSTRNKDLNIKINKKNKELTNRAGKIIGKQKIAKYNNNSEIKGTLVFTGDINNKCHEFVFIKNNKNINIDETIYKSFENVYFKDKESIPGQYWKDKFYNKESIPIFYIKNNGKVTDIGLTQLFKLEYKKSLYDGIYDIHKSKKLDLVQLILGYSLSDNKLNKYTDEEKKKYSPLKGRVQFSHLKNTNTPIELKKVEKVLNSPKATYYPLYIKQNNINEDKVDKYTTLMDEKVYISGWKRYPIHKKANLNNDEVKNSDLSTKFKPLDKGVIFEGKIRFHNLRKAEIGALLSALTFHNKENCFHNIGMAKPFGFGKIKIESIFENKNKYIETFEKLMINSITDWKKSKQLNELFKMAMENEKENLVYMELGDPDNRNSVNEFAEAKKQREYLKPYSQIFKPIPRVINLNSVDGLIQVLDNNRSDKQKLRQYFTKWKKNENINKNKKIAEKFREYFNNIGETQKARLNYIKNILDN